MKKWIVFAILFATLFFGSVIGFNMFKAKKIEEYLANRPIPEFSVTSVTVENIDWQPHLRAIGFIEPQQGVTLSNEVPGTIVKVNFESGQKVKAGSVLVEFDTNIEKANLKTAKAKLPAVKRNYRRMKTLIKKGSISQGKVDEAEAEYHALQGQIESYQATIDRRTIKAPFDGVVGLRNVYLGGYLSAGTPITRLENMDKMSIRFTIAQNDLSKIHVGQKMKINIDARPNTPFEATISAIEPAVNYRSGLIQVQATIPNEAKELRSGMFAKANILLPAQKDQIVVAQTAISYTLYGETVYILTEQTGKDGKTFLQADQQIVKLGKNRNGDIHVLSGLKKGDKIVTSGQVRLSNGAHVKIIKSDILNKPAEIPAL